MSRARVVLAASVGNALEWFDLLVFGYLSGPISSQFFPAGNEVASLLATFATFAVAFAARPLGAAVLGAYADRAGRTKALTLAVALMTVGTAIIAFAPTFHQIGPAATVVLVIARLIQGFSAGGEFGSATAFLAEQNPARRGFYASWQVASQGFATVLAAGFTGVLTAMLAPADLQGWGWRIPFMFGLLLGPVSLYIRWYVPEPPEYRAADHSATPLRETLATQKRRLLVAMSLIVLPTVLTYINLFMPGYATRELGIPASAAFFAAFVTGAVQLTTAPIFGALSDRYGRLRVMAPGAVAMLVLVYPLYLWLQATPTLAAMLTLQAFSGLVPASYFGPAPSVMAELFPVRVRTTGLALGYNLAVPLFGGLAPFLITWLIAASGDKLAPGYYVAFASAVGLLALLAARRLRA